MLFISLIFMVTGVCLIGASGVMITYTMITTGEKISFRRPVEWSSELKRWARVGGYGLGSIFLGMVAAMIATR